VVAEIVLSGELYTQAEQGSRGDPIGDAAELRGVHFVIAVELSRTLAESSRSIARSCARALARMKPSLFATGSGVVARFPVLESPCWNARSR
jgi:hypothetical protein